MTILHEILERKQCELEAAREQRGDAEMARKADAVSDPTRGFHAALRGGEPPAVIAEVKHRSPSKGVIREDFDPVACASAYERGGAAALSVLTDQYYFGGELAFLAAIRRAVSLPLLRKDFVIDAYQVDEARVAGADAVLLIVAALEPSSLASLHKRAEELGLDVLVEVHDEAQLEVAVAAGATLIGVNNRDLRSFEVDLEATERLGALLPSLVQAERPVTLVAESGIHDSSDIARMTAAGAGAFLVGESLMKQADLSRALRQLRRPL